MTLHLHSLPDTITESELLSLYERWQDARAVYHALAAPNDAAPIAERLKADLVEREAFQRTVDAKSAYSAAANFYTAQKRSVA